MFEEQADAIRPSSDGKYIFGVREALHAVAAAAFDATSAAELVEILNRCSRISAAVDEAHNNAS